MTSLDHVERLRWPGVLLQSYLSAGRHLAGLALPGVMVHVPLATLSLLVLAVASSGSAAVVNGRFQLIGISDGPLLIWTGVLTVAAGAGVLLATEAEWAASMASAVLALVAMPGLLAVPSVVLHGCTALGAIGRAYHLIQYRELPTPFTLAFGVVILPAAAVWGLQRGLSLLPEPLTTLGWGLAGFVTALAVTPFQAAVVARQFLHCMAWRTEVDDEDLAHGFAPRSRHDGPGGRRPPSGSPLEQRVRHVLDVVLALAVGGEHVGAAVL
ncbi:hypothetical protein [Nonomuraea sp. SYSU D8015]|uniref:hypothetical protein n=1 Tax=Nonomuraea sp. SYSU D8015 TaxID=2593644 RepID=UPI0016600B77|nr:hypothetical protein [Nonomuraea sp. SYSU D8015]